MAAILEVELYAEATTQEGWLEKIDKLKQPFDIFKTVGGGGKFERGRGSFYFKFLLPDVGVIKARVYEDRRY